MIALSTSARSSYARSGSLRYPNVRARDPAIDAETEGLGQVSPATPRGTLGPSVGPARCPATQRRHIGLSPLFVDVESSCWPATGAGKHRRPERCAGARGGIVGGGYEDDGGGDLLELQGRH
jgi:hypothetical protein